VWFSDPDGPWSRVLSIVMIVVGCILLLMPPGLCVMFTAQSVNTTVRLPFGFGLGALWILSVCGAAGIALIVWARRRLAR
jgi:hypothetical protein